MNSVMLLPGTDNVAGIRGIKSGSLPTAAQIDSMLDAVKADSNTIIFANRYGKTVLGNLSKAGVLQMSPNDFGYSSLIATWNGVPIVVTDTISNA